jgi:hypothetical protein
MRRVEYLRSHRGLWFLQRNPRSLDFKHKVARKALCDLGRYNPVKSSMGEGKVRIGDSRQPAIPYCLLHQRFSRHCTVEKVMNALSM